MQDGLNLTLSETPKTGFLATRPKTALAESVKPFVLNFERTKLSIFTTCSRSIKNVYLNRIVNRFYSTRGRDKVIRLITLLLESDET